MVDYRDPGRLEFDAVIRRSDVSGSSAFVEFPFDVSERFGAKGRVPVRVSYDGVPYRGSIVTMGGSALVLVLTSIQQQLGKGPGDKLHVVLELDSGERLVELDEDAEASWTQAGVLDAYRAMSYSHQREYAQWIADAKRPETRRRRIDQSIELITLGKRLK
ncbi:MAG TPA: YdeI/OmpD-associated family protein [Lacisediminihabitans sp.]|uniref:YdeI/OmpD-associated family protein n=1 Tax=Lacisediminihabitans sp. TaxID=2787631 RepID=UPI002EDA186E